MILRPALLFASLTPFVAIFAAVQSGRSTGLHFEIENVPAPATNDAASAATFRLVGGQADRASAPLEVLHDGLIPTGQDDPGRNFFFATGSGGGLILVDLGKEVEVASVATYSWHHGDRAAQSYSLYAAAGELPALPKWPSTPKGDWAFVEKVETSGIPAGQHGVLIGKPGAESLGKLRYLLFEVNPNGGKAPFNQTFFSEIDVIDAQGAEVIRIQKPKLIVKDFPSQSGKFTYRLDSTDAPDLAGWAAERLIPVMDEWYPKIIGMLPVPGVSPATEITFTLKQAKNLPENLRGVPAYASGDSVVFNADFMRREMAGEAVGAGIHEIVHVVQFGGRDEDGKITRGKPLPTWVTEGAADYIRWFLFEPEKKGARINRRNFEQARYDSSYRISAHFFDWVIRNYDKDLMLHINRSIHQGYREEIWKAWTGKTLQELGSEWKEANRTRLGL
ncbi:basic secretory protein-like protein [Verrucomicrobiaceae bacterium 227]